MLETIINNEKNKNIYIEKDWNGGGVGDSARSCPQAPVIHILKLVKKLCETVFCFIFKQMNTKNIIHSLWNQIL